MPTARLDMSARWRGVTRATPPSFHGDFYRPAGQPDRREDDAPKLEGRCRRLPTAALLDLHEVDIIIFIYIPYIFRKKL